MKKIAVGVVIILVVALAGYFFLPGILLQWGIDREREAGGLTEKRVLVDDHEIVYLEGGQGDTILMVHGFAANKDNWTRFAKFITPKYHVVALDLPGFGNSTYLDDASYGILDQVKRLDRFVQAVGLKKFHIVGNSMGGHISGRYAVEYPTKVLTLGLFNASGVDSPEKSELYKIVASGGKNPLVIESPEDFDKLMNFVFVKPPELPGFIKKIFIEEGLQHSAGNKKIFKQIRSDPLGLTPDLPKIKSRTLILWGDTDRLLHVSSTKVFEKGLQNSQTIIMKSCGHAPMIERPEEAAGYYLGFLGRK